MKPVVLVVDDEPDVLDLLDFCLSSQFSVVRAMNLEQVAAIVQTRTLDAVLLDLSLAETHGIATLTACKAILPPQVPIVVVTGDHGAAELVQPMVAGVALKGGIDFASLALQIKMAVVPEDVRRQFYEPIEALLKSITVGLKGLEMTSGTFPAQQKPTGGKPK